MDIQAVLNSLSQKRPIFHNEADFQHALAWELRERSDCKIRLELRMDIDNKRRTYLDILAEADGRKVAIELKYKMRALECTVQEEEFSLLHQGAHDIGRYDVLKDVQRLELMIKEGLVDEGYLIFLTNDSSYFSRPDFERPTADREFRIHEGSEINGSLSWSESTGAGTMKGRENSIEIMGKYLISWNPYSKLDDTAGGSLKSLIVKADSESIFSLNINPKPTVIKVNETIKPTYKILNQTNDRQLEIYQHICSIDEIPLSQFDLRDKLLERLKAVGYRVQSNRDFANHKIDIWADKGNDQIALEVRYKTGLLHTIYKDKSINLKNQGAQDISRYDFLKDLEKIEYIIMNRPGTKGYAVIITNDHNYWEKPHKVTSVDEDFRIYQGRNVHGLLSWKNASNGTTHKREESIHIKGQYIMDWQPFLTLGSGKYQTFKFLAVEVSADNH